MHENPYKSPEARSEGPAFTGHPAIAALAAFSAAALFGALLFTVWAAVNSAMGW